MLKLLICPKLRITAKEAFLKRTSLQVSIPALHGAMRLQIVRIFEHSTNKEKATHDEGHVLDKGG